MPRSNALALIIACLACLATPRAHAEEKLNAERDLIVFVGKRLSVTPRPTKELSFDNKFEAQYQVLQLVFGRYDAPKITFTVYDHYGPPAFARYDTALMFVSRYDGKLYHEKYQYIPVYPTVDGRWAGFGDPYQFEPDVHRGTLKPVPIKFASGVKDPKTGKAPTEGNFIEDLFRVKKNGVLKARGWF